MQSSNEGTGAGGGETSWRRRAASLTATAIFGIALVAGGASAHAGHGHPAKIHDGTCAQLGAVAFTLNGVGANENQQGTPIATPETVNPKNAYQMMIGQTTIGASLDSLLASDHTIMLYDGDETMQGIACGDLGGARLGDELIVGLAEMNIPGHIGVAVLRDQGDKTEVTIYVGHGLAPVSASAANRHGAPAAAHDMPGMDDMAGMDMGATATPAAHS
ncbi:MAG TPA: hypothetical protein VFX03_14350 [Thermomicrobiales bacterium]|nr:hypothetical protein [Thermomicrobiales bacterium]